MVYKLKIFKLLTVMLIVLTLASCKEKKHVTLDIPDQVIIYSNGKQIEVSKDSKHFQDIITLTNERIPEYVGVLSSLEGIKENEVLDNGVVISFIYESEKQHTRGTEVKNFNKLLFPLTYKNLEKKPYNDLMLYVYKNKLLSGPGSAKPSKKLNKLIDNLIKENKD